VKFRLADKRGSGRMMTGVDGYAGHSVTSMTAIKICFIRQVYLCNGFVETVKDNLG
jgi:hypothetical protein